MTKVAELLIPQKTLREKMVGAEKGFSQREGKLTEWVLTFFKRALESVQKEQGFDYELVLWCLQIIGQQKAIFKTKLEYHCQIFLNI